MDNSTSATDLIEHSNVNITESETRIIGLIIFFEILFCYIPYCLVLTVFIKSAQFRKHISYQIMVGLGINDLIASTGWLMMAIMMVLNAKFNFIFGKIAGAFSHTGWQGMVLFSVILAVNRSDAIIGFLPFVQSGKERFWKTIYKTTYVFIFFLFISNLLPNMGLIMDHLTVHYERIAFYLEVIYVNTAITLFGICWIFYVISFIFLIKQCLKGSYKTSLDTLLFLQTIVITMFKTFIAILWMNYTPQTNFAIAVCMILNTLEPGYHPYLYLIFNRRLRKEFRQLFSSKSLKSITDGVIEPAVHLNQVLPYNKNATPHSQYQPSPHSNLTIHSDVRHC